MTAKVVALRVNPGIQRDGTQFNAPSYVDGQWVRFQYGLPKKMGGYNGIFLNASGISRGMIMSSQDQLNYVTSGYDGGLEQWQTLNVQGVGSGPTKYSEFNIGNSGSSYTDGTYTNVPMTGGSGTSMKTTIVISGGAVTNVNVTSWGSKYVQGDVLSANASSIGGTGSGFSCTLLFVQNENNLWQFDIGYDSTGGGNNQLIAHPGQNLTDITSTVNIRPFYNTYPNTTAMQFVGVFNASGTTTSGSKSVTFTTTVSGVGAGVSVTGTGIPSDTQVVSVAVVDGVFTATLNNPATASGTVFLNFDNNISVSGGLVMLHPYLFVYGNYGLIQNCAAGDFTNWTSSDSNANNVSTGKIVKGLPLRGGTTSPAGLFWSTDSVIRVSYTPTTVTSGTTALTYYWRYDLITSQSSILSSQCVIEYDGIFYWIGTDRFLMYNGVVAEIKNTQNMNWFFDNLNYQQRQKVWVTKVPRWGEIWWFYPRGDATECTDAIIYNVREQVWYDSGSASGSARSAGVFTEVFHYPIWAGNVANNQGKFTIWQHETGTDQIYTNQVDAILSYFETNILANLAGLVGATQVPGDNVWTRLERVEPDFVMTGEMTMIVKGKGYADDVDYASSPYSFDNTTLKIDMKEQRREMRLQFISNAEGGNFFLGRVILSLDVGDVRGTGNP